MGTARIRSLRWYRIVIDGDIDSRTAADFAASALRSDKIGNQSRAGGAGFAPLLVELNSSGGSVSDAMQVGKLIRGSSLITIVRRKGPLLERMHFYSCRRGQEDGRRREGGHSSPIFR